MKKISILLAGMALLSIGCSDVEPSVPAPADGEPRVEVAFRLETVDTDTSLEPMTRATSYKEWIANGCCVLILKRADTRWIVEAKDTVLIDSKMEWKDEHMIDQFPPCSFNFELRPGDYRIVAVINAHVTTRNDQLVPGMVVADDADPDLSTPLVTYLISDHWMNETLRQLNREIFVAVTDFTVPKSGDLHSDGRPAVRLRAERRVGKFRLLLKQKYSPVNYFHFNTTAHEVNAVLTATTKPFPEGIDALGNMYYGKPETYSIEWCMSTVGHFHPSGANAYQLNQTNSTVFSPFLFVGPEDGELEFQISKIYITGQGGTPPYSTNEVFTRKLVCNRTCGLVLETSDDTTWDPEIHVVESLDADGVPENAATLFDPFFEWNAEFNK